MHRQPSGITISIDRLTKRYRSRGTDKWALRDVSFMVEPGIFGLLGRNGAGKTTLLQILSTMLDPTSGQVMIGPYDSKRQRWDIRTKISLGFLPQEQGYYPKLSVKETLRYLASLQGLENSRKKIDEVLEAVNLTDRATSKVGALSGGMRRRLGLAQALMGDPKVVIIDEPTSGLDPVEQQRFRMLLGMLGARGQQTILLSTHIVADIATVASRLAVLEQGTLVFNGSVNELAARARGSSWLWRTTMEQVDYLRRAHPVIITSISPITDGSATLPNEVIARIEGSQPAPNARLVEPTLEDGYLSIVGATEQSDDIRQRILAKIQK